ncbi:MAG: histidine kinase dimerization/phospho-acceptor domain-containing protein [Armatimonadota bacterium]|nr:hypothetical protein [bacterium]MDW8320460.1 histidine kinase dimerization/phospho-acceptor domain-containing protein [Armatimonadota bacterium]
MPESTCDTLTRKLQRWREVRSIVLSRFNHDLRAPLTAIVGFAELLGDEELTPEQRVYVQRILEATEKIVAILNEVQKVLNEVEQEA